jgi:hypothetical protein
MIRSIYFGFIAAILLPGLALAKSTGFAGDWVTREVEAMQRGWLLGATLS